VEETNSSGLCQFLGEVTQDATSPEDKGCWGLSATGPCKSLVGELARERRDMRALPGPRHLRHRVNLLKICDHTRHKSVDAELFNGNTAEGCSDAR
jgi:hypothetical protein